VRERWREREREGKRDLHVEPNQGVFQRLYNRERLIPKSCSS
jgi:hypothetical protein